MKLAVMQPYLFPYLGYFQLLEAVDRFVVLDDVTFIKGGWINRNRILLDGEPHLFTVPLKKSSTNRLIRDIHVSPEPWRPKLLRMLRAAYQKAPHRDPALELVESILEAAEGPISDLAFASVTGVCDYLGMEREFVRTTSVYGNDDLKGQERVLDICKREGAATYVNVLGGRELYGHAAFAAAGIELRFVETLPREYPQLGGPFQPGLSIIDVLMFNSPDAVRELMQSHRLTAGEIEPT